MIYDKKVTVQWLSQWTNKYLLEVSNKETRLISLDIVLVGKPAMSEGPINSARFIRPFVFPFVKLFSHDWLMIFFWFSDFLHEVRVLIKVTVYIWEGF